MPKHIHVWIGLEIQAISFVQGRLKTADPSINDYAISDNEYIAQPRKEIYVPDGCYFYLPEKDLHPRKIKDKISAFLNYSNDRVVHFNTHSHFCIDILGEMIASGELSHQKVTIHAMTDDNSEIHYDSTFDSEGYLLNWIAGELSR